MTWKKIIILALAAIIMMMVIVALLGGPDKIKRQDCENQYQRMYGMASTMHDNEVLVACITYCWKADY